MEDKKHCGRCGEEVPLRAPFGHCPKCLLELGFAATGEADDRLDRSSGKENRRFGDYELGRLLGRGGMGVVYEAMQTSLHRPVALKMILDSQVASPVMRRRFAIEAEAAAKLDHPNIVPIYEVGEHEHQPFLTMKLVQGENLRQKLARGEVCVTSPNGTQTKADLHERQTKVARFMAEVSRAVHHAHQHGVLHRDLKPANILIDGEGQPHLTDFGLAKLLDPAPTDSTHGTMTLSGTALGTPSYMAPEQARGERLSAAADIYSLGAILYELLTGQPPFKAPTPLETLRMVVEQEPKQPCSASGLIHPDLGTICMKCLEKNPNVRYGTALALAEDLERWGRQEPIQARPSGPLLRLGRWTKRNRVGTALILSLFFGLAASTAFMKKTWDNGQLQALRKREIVRSIVTEVEDLWKDPNKSHVRISSGFLAALADRSPRPTTPEALRLSYALGIEQDPVETARLSAPFLEKLEQKMTQALGRPVLMDLMIYKAGSTAFRTIARGEADFRSLGALAYLQAKQASPGVQPVARVESDREAVIFARKHAGITNRSQLAGKRLALPHTNSILSSLAKAQLVQAGLYRTNLNLVLNLASMESYAEAMSGERDVKLGEDEGPHSQWPVMIAVLTNGFDAGVVKRRYFERYRYGKPGLVEIDAFPIPLNVYAARAGLDAEVVGAFRQSLFSFESKEQQELLRVIEDKRIARTSLASDADFDGIRALLTNEVLWFESGPGSAPVAKAVQPQSGQ